MNSCQKQKLYLKKVVKQKDLFNLLANSKRQYKRGIIDNADKKLIEAICESCDNLLIGNLPINSTDKEKLRKYRKSLVKLAENTSIETKKKVLNQKGGFLNILIPAIISGIATIVASVINKPAVVQQDIPKTSDKLDQTNEEDNGKNL